MVYLQQLLAQQQAQHKEINLSSDPKDEEKKEVIVTDADHDESLSSSMDNYSAENEEPSELASDVQNMQMIKNFNQMKIYSTLPMKEIPESKESFLEE